MRRTVGISSLERNLATDASYNTLSDSLSAKNLGELQSELLTFQSSLKSFAIKHGQKIKSDPEFRTTFSMMCNELGVDPLRSGRKGIWDWIGFGDWTYELALQLVDVCLRTRDRNGGLHEIEEVMRLIRSLRQIPNQEHQTNLNKSRVTFSDLIINSSTHSSINQIDIIRAIKSLEPLGSGYSIINIGHKTFIRSIPIELDQDCLSIFDSIISSDPLFGFATHQKLKKFTGWNQDRVQDCLSKSIWNDSLVWIDLQSDQDRFYIPALFIFQDHSFSNS